MSEPVGKAIKRLRDMVSSTDLSKEKLLEQLDAITRLNQKRARIESSSSSSSSSSEDELLIQPKPKPKPAPAVSPAMKIYMAEQAARAAAIKQWEADAEARKAATERVISVHQFRIGDRVVSIKDGWHGLVTSIGRTRVHVTILATSVGRPDSVTVYTFPLNLIRFATDRELLTSKVWDKIQAVLDADKADKTAPREHITSATPHEFLIKIGGNGKPRKCVVREVHVSEKEATIIIRSGSTSAVRIVRAPFSKLFKASAFDMRTKISEWRSIVADDNKDIQRMLDEDMKLTDEE